MSYAADATGTPYARGGDHSPADRRHLHLGSRDPHGQGRRRPLAQVTGRVYARAEQGDRARESMAPSAPVLSSLQFVPLTSMIANTRCSRSSGVSSSRK